MIIQWETSLLSMNFEWPTLRMRDAAMRSSISHKQTDLKTHTELEFKSKLVSQNECSCSWLAGGGGKGRRG